MQFPRKLINQTGENGKKPNFGHDFGSFGSILSPPLLPKFFLWDLPQRDIRYCCKVPLYKISRKINEPNLRKWQKNLVSGTILANFAQIRAATFFFQKSGFVSH